MKHERFNEIGLRVSSNSTKTSLKINLFINVLYEILAIALPLFTAPYVSRIFDADGIGIYSYTQSLIAYFTLFAMLGTSLYGVKKIASVRDDKLERSKCFWGIEIVTIFSSSICLLLWIAFSILYTRYSYYMLAMSFTILGCLFDISWFYKGLEKFKYTVSINLFVKLVILVLVFTIVKEKSDLGKYILISSLGVFLGNITMWFFLPRFVSSTRIGWKELTTHFKATLIYFAPSIATTIYTVLDKTLIGLITQDDNQNGYYEQATKIINICKSLCFIGINGVMTSRMSYCFAQNNKKEISAGLISTLHLTMFLSIGACFGLIGISNVFVPLFFGDGYNQTVVILYILAPIVPIICISNVYGSLVYTPSGNIKKATLFMIIGSIVNLCLNIPLIIMFASFGAALASVIAELVISILFLYYANGILKTPNLILIISKKIIAGVLMLLAVFLFDGYLYYLNHVFLLIIDVLLGLFIYLTSLFLMKDESITIVFKSFFKRSIKPI